MECPHCGSSKIVKNGTKFRKKIRYQEYYCLDCGKYPAIKLFSTDYKPEVFIQPKKERKEPKKVLMIGDLHCGHRVGLTPPEYNVNDGLYDLRADAWAWFANTLKEIGKVDIVIANGDLIDGRGEASGGTELLSTDLNEQCDMATSCIDEISHKDCYITYGTPYHVGKKMDYENIIADNLNATIKDELMLDVNGFRIHAKHKVGSSSIPHGRGTAPLKSAMWNQLRAISQEEKGFDLIVRSHVHYFLDAKTSGLPRAMILPALQLEGSKYGKRQCENIVDFGMILLTVYSSDEYNITPYLAKVRNIEKEVIYT